MRVVVCRRVAGYNGVESIWGLCMAESERLGGGIDEGIEEKAARWLAFLSPYLFWGLIGVLTGALLLL